MCSSDLNEPCHDVLGYGSKGRCFDPLGKIINSDQDEAMSIVCRRLDLSNHINSPHCEWPRSRQNVERNKRNMYLVGIDLAFVAGTGMLMTISFHGRPVVACCDTVGELT